jgi:hypothetical protein
VLCKNCYDTIPKAVHSTRYCSIKCEKEMSEALEGELQAQDDIVPDGKPIKQAKW